MKYTRPTVLSVFLGRCHDLGTETKGVALAATLAFFAPIYLVVVGIYGIGEIVRYKIELQNAADNAAYSAAVVQADYLSRMAVVNKAMAWTYVDLQKRSLDYAMDSFISQVLDQLQKDWEWAASKCIGKCCPEHEIKEINYFVGDPKHAIKAILMAGVSSPGKADRLTIFNKYEKIRKRQLENAQRAYSFRKQANKDKIKQYRDDIRAMNQKLTDLKKEMNDEVKKAALEVAAANMEECKDDYIIKIIGNGGSDESFEIMKTSKENEKNFISFADMIDKDAKYSTDETNQSLKKFDPKAVFGPGTDVWVQLDTSRQEGFNRYYQQSDDYHYAKWTKAWNHWTHVSHKLLCICPPPGKKNYGYETTVVRGTDVAVKYGIFSCKPLITRMPIGGKDDFPAKPWLLKEKFFGEGGSITVAIARKTRNPLKLFSSSDSSDCDGMHSVFNVKVDKIEGSRPEYMLAVASARAGYKKYNTNKEEKRNSRQYILGNTPLQNSEREKQWNLCETDWDGLLIPVRYTNSYVSGNSSFDNYSFQNASDDILSTVIKQSGWVDKDGKSVSNVPDWSNMEAPGGMISGNGKLDWKSLGTYLRH